MKYPMRLNSHFLLQVYVYRNYNKSQTPYYKARMKDKQNKDNDNKNEDMKKYQVDSSDSENQNQAQNQQPELSIHSKSRKSDYDEILDQNIISPRTKDQMINELSKNGIFYKQQRYLETTTPYELCISKINHTKNYEIVVLTILIGPYEQEVTILNVFKESFINKLEPLFYQGHTNVYLFTYKSKELVCKSTAYVENNKMHVDVRKEEIIHSLREYCISNIMSTLKIGPKIYKSFKFDMVISESGVEFYLEPCATYSQRGFSGDDKTIMTTNLKEMHILGFIHRDIKPHNIMYSKNHEKYVYIDFGISEFRREKPGELIKSKFLGTYAYCTEEFKKIFNTRQSDWVDAYMNDAWGLKLSVEEMEKSFDPQKLATETFSTTSNQIIFNFELLERQIKQLIYSNQIQKIYKIVEMKDAGKNFQRTILNFFYEVPATESLRKYYLNEISDDIKKQKIFEELWQCFKTPVFIESYKGTRTFLTIGEENSNLRFKQIYSKIKDKYSNITKDIRIYKRESEELLMNNKLINEMGLKDYEKRLIQYVDFTNLRWQSSFQEKFTVCKKYAQSMNIEYDQSQMSERELIEEIFQIISLKFIQESHVQHWDIVIKAIENYFILLQKTTFNLSEYLMKFINNILADLSLKNLNKVQRMFELLATRKFLIRRNKCLIQFVESVEVENFIEQKLKQFLKDQKRKAQGDTLIFEFLLKTFKLYRVDASVDDFFEKAFQIGKQIKWFTIEYPQLQNIFNFIEFNVGIFLQRNDRIFEGRKLHQQNSHRQITRQGSLSPICFEMIKNYEMTLQIKKLKKYMSLIDQAINCPQIGDEYFTKIRIFIELYFKNVGRAKLYIKKLENFILRNMNFYLVLNTYQWTVKMIAFSRINYIEMSEDLKKFHGKTVKWLLSTTDHYLQRKKPLKYRESKFWFHLNLLNNCVRAELGQGLQFDEQNTQKIYQSINVTKTKSFKKVMSLPRQYFNSLDQTFIFFFDICILGRREKYEQMVSYIKDRMNLIEQVINIANRAQKTRLTQALSLITKYLCHSNRNDLLSEYIDLIIAIFKNPRVGSLFFVEDFQKKMINGLVKTGHYEFIMESITKATIFHSRHIANSNMLLICGFYSSIASQILYYYKEKQMVLQIKKVLPSINPKENPLFGFFLLYFIFPCNRRRMIKFLYQCLDYINHTGKWIILSRLYKQQGKLRYITRWRKKYLIKKDFIYPSKYKLDLQDMKGRLNIDGELNNFRGIFMQILQQKLIKLGKCCEIYSQFKELNKINKVFDFSQLDLPIRERTQEAWQRQIWQ